MGISRIKQSNRNASNITLRSSIPMLFFFSACLFPFITILALPVTYVVPTRSKECLYDKLEADEFLSMSLFISQGKKLVANAIIEGPVALSSDNTATELNESLQKFGMGRRYGIDMSSAEARTIEEVRKKNVDKTGTLRMEEKVDFENFEYADAEIDDDDDVAKEYDDDDRIRTHMERKHHKLMRLGLQRTEAQLRRDGEPYERTIQVVSPGWYRVCASALYSEVSVELDMRKSSELGPPDASGHVPSVEKNIEILQEKELDENAAKEEDLKKSKEYIKELHQLLLSIKQKQSTERHRLELHQEINSHAHSRMVVSSLMETALFIGVTGFQVYTIRKWFQGGPLLG